MNTNEVGQFLDRLRASWPNLEWPDGTLALWAEDVAELDYPLALAALTAMRRECEFPSAAALIQRTRPSTSKGAVHGSDGKIFLWGTGWIDTPESRERETRALEPPMDPHTSHERVQSVRSALASARAATRTHRDGEEASRAHVARQVDAAAAALRLPGARCATMGHEDIDAVGSALSEELEDTERYPYCAECLKRLGKDYDAKRWDAD